MTLNLKLVRHHDGKWTALTSETDDLAQAPSKEWKSAPIDPVQLLKALDSLLSPDGGIKSIEAVPRSASVMKKFSKKLVSRCVYCNVLQATKPDILSEYLDKGGWETINTWLQYAKSTSTHAFLLEMLKLCKLLPMTLERLKENNTAKLIKSLTKHENKEVKILSTELVTQWMGIIKEKKPEITIEKKKKKEKDKEKTEKHTKVEPVKEEKSSPKHTVESPKTLLKVKNLKRPSIDEKEKKVEVYEDVKIDPEPLIPAPKKPRPDRPKTAKIYQKKFRATGLEEETPLPKNINKKVTTVDKSIVAAAKNVMKMHPTTAPERITEKKIKPENLMAINENTNTKGIKLIPAKPRPTYTLQESGSFIDALISQPVTPVKRKKKQPQSKVTTVVSQTSPTLAPPKLQFYKDTLEMNDENKKEESEKAEKKESSDSRDEDSKDDNNKENTIENMDENVPMDTTEEGGHTPTNDEIVESNSSNNDSQDVKEKAPFDPNNLRSILSHGKRRGKKKIVKWMDDENIKEIFYFEMDETERENVTKNQNFYDMKSIEMRREREAMELAKRQSGDKTQELRRWWPIPILIDLPPPLVIPGYNSQEKHTEMARQQSTLQEIYFTREMIPESPHEPDLEIVAPLEPKVIPLDEENLIGTLNDYSNYKITKQPLPADILSTIMRLSASQPALQNLETLQSVLENKNIQQPRLNPEPMNNQQNIPMQINPPFEAVPNLLHPPPNSLLGHPPPQFNQSPEGHNMVPQEWRGPDMSPPHPEQFFGGFPGNQNMPQNQLLPPPQQPPIMDVRPPLSNSSRPPFKGSSKGGNNTRNRLCRYFAAGHCRFGPSCTFLHPGVNGPRL